MLWAAAITVAALIPVDLFFANPRQANPKISPDGVRVSWLAPGEGGVRNVWVQAPGDEQARLATHDASRGITNYFWHPDSRRILYFQDRDGNEDFHLYEAPLDGSPARDLTPEPGVRAEFLALGKDDILLLMNRRARRYFEVFRLNWKSRELTLDTENPGDIVQWAADGNLQIRAALAYKADGSQEILVRNAAGDAWRVIRRLAPGQPLGRLVSGPVMYRIAEAVEKIDPDAGTLTVVAQDSPYEAVDFLTHPATGAPQAAAFERERREWRFFDPEVKSAFERLRRQHSGSDITVLSRDAADAKWIVSVGSAEQPARYYLYDRAKDALQSLFESRPDLRPFRLAPMEPVSFKARDGLPLHGYLTRPLDSAKAGPMVILVHGGPWVRDSYGYSGVVQFLASRGYAVLQVNYRGSSGYGADFLNAGNREWGGKMLDDLVDAKRWAVKNGYADAARVGIMGASFGGYLTLSALAFAPEEFACGIDMFGQSNLITFLGMIPPVAGPVLSLYRQRVGDLKADEAMLRARSPFFHARRIVRPLLVAQGSNDPRVPQVESDQIVTALQEQNKPVTYMVFPDEGHGLVRPANILKFMAEVERFLGRHLGSRSEKP